MSAQDGIDDLKSKQGIPNSVSPTSLADDTLQQMWDQTEANVQATSSGFFYDSDTSATDPGNSGIKFNNAAPELATEIYVNEMLINSFNYKDVAGSIVVGDILLCNQQDASQNNFIFRVNGAPIDNTGWFTIPVEVLTFNGGYVDGVAINLSLTTVGDRPKLKTQALYFSFVNQVPAFDDTAEVMKFELVEPLRNPPEVAYDNSTGVFTFNLNGEVGGAVTVSPGRQAPGGSEDYWFWAEYLDDPAIFPGGDGTWKPYGLTLDKGVLNNKPETVQADFFVEKCIFGQQFRIMHASEDAGELVGIYARSLPPMGGVDNQPNPVASCQFNIQFLTKP